MAFIDSSIGVVSFRTRFLGLDRDEVHAFIANVLEDYGLAQRELARLRESPSDTGGGAGPDGSAATPPSASRDVHRILESAQRVADDIEAQAMQQSARTVQEATAKAATILATAELRAGELTADALRLREEAAAVHARAQEDAQAQTSEILKAAEQQAISITEEARCELMRIEERIGVARAGWDRVRQALESAASTAESALQRLSGEPATESASPRPAASETVSELHAELDSVTA
jgi:cell division septum initiation protein DivIVA